MSYYATDNEISAQFFNGETVPSENTIIESRNSLFKDRAKNYVDTKASELSDSGKKNLFLYVYGEYLKGSFIPNPLIVEQIIRQEKGPAIKVTKKWQESSSYFRNP